MGQLPPSEPTSTRGGSSVETSKESYLEKIKSNLADAEAFKAYSISLEAIRHYPDDAQFREHAAILLLKTGATHEAKKIIESILLQFMIEEEGQMRVDLQRIAFLDPETIYLFANIFKLTWQLSKKFEDLLLSRDLFEIHFSKTKDHSSGADAACLSWLCGDDTKAESLAGHVIKHYEKDKKTAEVLASLAQCYLIRGDGDLAQAMLNRVQENAGKNYNVIVDSLHQLKILLNSGFHVPRNLFDVLKPPTIVVFTGQMIDKPGQEQMSFIQDMEHDVKKAIRSKIDEIDAKIGYSSCACGSDILFIEAMIEKGVEVNIVLPFDSEDFLASNVTFAGSRWEHRFKKCLELAKQVQFATEEKFLGHDMLYRFGNMVLHGMAEMRGNFLLSPPHLLAVWDSQPLSLAGNASDFIDHWADIRTLHIIDLDEIKTQFIAKNDLPQLPQHLATIKQIRQPIGDTLYNQLPRTIKTMLFSDLAGFSKLKEEHISAFINFLAELRSNLEKLAPNPNSLNTWGDAIFAVMDNASDLADFAITLSELVPEISRNTRGLPPINVRVSLHAGPVYEAIDPFLKIPNYYGGHINRAARLEPVTVIGEVYATEQFMALLISEQSAKRVEKHQMGLPFSDKYAYEYVGVTALAKGFGEQPVYHLRWI